MTKAVASSTDDGVTQIALDALKQRSVTGFNMPQTIPRGMDELQTHTNPAFQPFNLANDGYSSSDSSLSSSKESLFLHAEVESSDTVVMPVMVTNATNIKEQRESMKVLGKIQALKFINPQAQGLSSSTWGVVRRELGFKYRDSIQAAQSRPSETRGKKKLN